MAVGCAHPQVKPLKQPAFLPLRSTLLADGIDCWPTSQHVPSAGSARQPRGCLAPPTPLRCGGNSLLQTTIHLFGASVGLCAARCRRIDVLNDMAGHARRPVAHTHTHNKSKENNDGSDDSLIEDMKNTTKEGQTVLHDTSDNK